LQRNRGTEEGPAPQGRPDDRGRDRAQGVLLAGPAGRHQRWRGRLRDRRQDHGEGSVRLRLRRPVRRVRQPGVERHHRSDQGGSHRAAGRGFRGWPAHHHRGDGRRGAEEAGACHAAGRRRNGRRNGLLNKFHPQLSVDVRKATDRRGLSGVSLSLRVRSRPLVSTFRSGYRGRYEEGMARGINRLSGADLRRTKPGLYGDGNNLFLQVSVSKANRKQINRSWSFRYANAAGRIIEMGLGSLNVIGLKEARDQAREYCALRLRGIDPLQHRNDQRAATAAAGMKSITFEAAAHAYIAAHRNEWRSQEHAAEWPASLRRHVFPTIGSLPVSTIDTALVVKALEKV